MFKNILVPTDGSDLAAKAVEQGVLFAKEIGAKITAVTVTEPSNLLSVSPTHLEYTPIEYHEGLRRNSACHRSDAAKLAGVFCDTLHASVNRSIRRLPKPRGEKVRFDRDGLTSASRCLGGCPRQRDGQGAHHSKIPVLVNR